ncbi:C4-dicarboxylate ABC transporter [Thiorhodococcus mannitoliphagus]|uniref:C4-dicarboxylate ABC transporter n=1 Tax=Thiorhodococcus mannitoliphagus TaxID=329406 RepID=A0A6P1DRK7_9GAMM|nr:tellurite resistance/C4-dicarboxylate transporter family protein [Thiorhodococcus mannitoliphagus]NEX20688.1 C4-dicarboxylate ABC transporter [Thiorhodococcus mannitoliphagus]
MRYRTRRQAVASLTQDWIASLPPSSFALVMATGIVSIASETLGLHWLALPLLLVNLVAFAALWVMTLLRLFIDPARLMGDLRAHALGPGHFTIVAGTSVIGVQILMLTDQGGLAAGLWLFALCLWLLITYAFFTAVIVQPAKPALTDGLSGVWLIASVATQSIAVLGTLVADRFPDHQTTVLFLCLLFFCMGCMLYLNIIALIFYRLTFMPVEPGSLTPPYWISMGATAIATQAGATLIIHAGESPLLLTLVPFLKGFTLFFWAAGTWWIPLLIGFTVWTYWLRRVPLVYTPLFWGAVFPLGMYTASTHQLALALEIEGLSRIPAMTVYVALLAWGLAFFGLLRRLLRGAAEILNGLGSVQPRKSL